MSFHTPAHKSGTAGQVSPNDGPDFDVRNEGSIVQFMPWSKAAEEWIEANVQYEPWQRLGRSLNVDHRYAEALLQGIVNDGLTVA